MNQSTPRCRMSSWHDDITGYHNEETDDLHIGENDLKDLAMDRSPLITLFSRPWRFHSCSSLTMWSISLLWEVVQVSQMHVVMKTDEIPQLQR